MCIRDRLKPFPFGGKFICNITLLIKVTGLNESLPDFFRSFLPDGLVGGLINNPGKSNFTETAKLEAAPDVSFNIFLKTPGIFLERFTGNNSEPVDTVIINAFTRCV